LSFVYLVDAIHFIELVLQRFSMFISFTNRFKKESKIKYGKNQTGIN